MCDAHAQCTRHGITRPIFGGSDESIYIHTSMHTHSWYCKPKTRVGRRVWTFKPMTIRTLQQPGTGEQQTSGAFLLDFLLQPGTTQMFTTIAFVAIPQMVLRLQYSCRY